MGTESDHDLTDKPAAHGFSGFPEAGSIEPGVEDEPPRSELPLTTDDDALTETVTESAAFKQLQAEINEKKRAVVREVNSTHAGQPRALVYAHLRQRFRDEGFIPDDPAFGEIVDAIAEGGLED
jgi:hypothetical protein